MTTRLHDEAWKGRAFTLVELTLAMSILALIGTTVVAAAFAVSSAQASTDKLGDNVHAGRSSMVRIERLIRQAQLVSGGQADSLSLWMGDTDGNGRINADETVYLVYLSNERVVRMRRIQFPDIIEPVLKAVLNVEMTLTESADPCMLDMLVACLSYVTETDVAAEVDHFEFRYAPAAPLARTVSMLGRFGTGADSVSLNTTVRLRRDATDNVLEDSGEYVLALPTPG